MLKGRSTAALGMLVLVLCACGKPASPPPAPAAASPVPSPFAIASPSPAPTAVAAPAPRAGAALEYDPVSQQLLLVGGMPDPLHPNQTDLPGQDFWAWRPNAGWTHLTPPTLPPPFYLASLVWDAELDRVVLIPPSGLDIWEWDGAHWSAAGTGPQTAALSGAAYDTHDRVLVVLGQSTFLAQPASRVAMWVWDGSTWTANLTPMSSREEAGVAYDQLHQQLVVYGGYGDAKNLTWLWDGTTWTGRQTDAFPIANQSSAAFDPVRMQVVLYAPGGETWTWDGNDWKLRSREGPGIRRDQSMAFDAAIGEVVLFGGKSPPPPGSQDEVFHNDLWAWDGNAWTEVA